MGGNPKGYNGLQGGASSIINPNSMQLESPTYLSGPIADPHWIVHQSPGAIKPICLGGESRVERSARQILVALIRSGWSTDLDDAGPVDLAVELAMDLQNKLHAAQNPQLNKGGDDDVRPTDTGTPRQDDSEAESSGKIAQ